MITPPIKIKNITVQDLGMTIKQLSFVGTNIEIKNLGIRLPGPSGESAYASALKGGYIGTEQDFYKDLVQITEEIEAITNEEIENIINW